MTRKQERAITLALNILNVGFFECPSQAYQYFVDNDEWALLLTAGQVNAIDTPPLKLALAVLEQAIARQGFFLGMTDFRAPRHFCSFLVDKIARGERTMEIEPCAEGQQTCPYATFEGIRQSAVSLTVAGKPTGRTPSER